MRIRIVHKPGDRSVDGVRLDRFEPGQLYEVGNSLGSLLLAEGWARPIADDEDAAGTLVRDYYPGYFDEQPDASDFKRASTARSKHHRR